MRRWLQPALSAEIPSATIDVRQLRFPEDRTVSSGEHSAADGLGWG